MFENYDYIPGTHIVCDTSPAQSITDNRVKLPLAYYNVKDEFIGYSWRYGDSIVLEFNTEGEVQYNDIGAWEDAETYLQGKRICLDIFDFRHELVYEDFVDASTCVKFYLDPNSCKRLIKGTYTFKVTLIDDEDNTTYTLMPQSSEDICYLYIN